MNDTRNSNRPSVSAWAQRLKSPQAVHAIGGSLCIVIGTLIGATAMYGRQPQGQLRQGDVVVDLADAAQLVAESDRWRQAFATEAERARTIDARVEQISTWLPTQLDWETTNRSIHALAEQTGVKVIAFNEAQQHVGSRIGIVAATCRLEGSFASICRFLSRLESSETPIACAGVELSRPNTNDVAVADAHEQHIVAAECRATLALRIPFAAEQSVASRLLKKGTNDAN